VDVTQAMLARIARLDGALKSYVTVTAGRALEQARRAEAEIARGFWRGPLHGVPLALKDLCNTDYAPTSAGMTIYRDYIPSRSATVVDRLEAAGAVILGKLAMTEGAHALHHPGMPCPSNPWHADYWMGISSSGSGVATAAGLCFGATGSDTGGSIRLPSAACGVNYSAVETLWSHRDTWPSREAEYSPYLAERMREAASVTPLQLIEAQQERRTFSGRLAALFRDMDLLLMPVLPDPLARMTDYRGLGRLIRFTAPFNASGSPTITLPGGVDAAGLPVGFQLVGPHLSEDLLLRAGHAFQCVTDWHTRHPQEPSPS
jgi:Asp-tRNA(Asn)/Glu-tRNA(Gln) amidotransferase A subunit family amidase